MLYLRLLFWKSAHQMSVYQLLLVHVSQRWWIPEHITNNQSNTKVDNKINLLIKLLIFLNTYFSK